MPHRAVDLSERLRPALPFAVLGAACVVCGGLVSAATAAAPSELGTWAAAYLVLVAGVAQVTLGVGGALLVPAPASRLTVVALFTAWNFGNVAVLVGTLAGVVCTVDVGGAVLVVALAGWAWRVRTAGGGWALRLYRLLIGVLVVSVPIGLLLAGGG